MRTRQKLMEARLGILALAEELQNIMFACKLAGISRTHLYETKDALEKFGVERFASVAGRRPRMPNETPAETARNRRHRHFRLELRAVLPSLCHRWPRLPRANGAN